MMDEKLMVLAFGLSHQEVRARLSGYLRCDWEQVCGSGEELPDQLQTQVQPG